MSGPNSRTTFESRYGNYYGRFAVCLINRKPHASVENYNGHNWKPCSRELYDAVKAECIAAKETAE